MKDRNTGELDVSRECQDLEKGELTVEVYRIILDVRYGGLVVRSFQQADANALCSLHHAPKTLLPSERIRNSIILCVIPAPTLVERHVKPSHPCIRSRPCIDFKICSGRDDASGEGIRGKNIGVWVRNELQVVERPHW